MFIKKNKNSRTNKLNRGMTYIELIVVLSIFATMSAAVIYSYRDFQGKIDVKNLGSDIALKLVEAQKSALSGKLPLVAYPTNWKPAFGVYFNISGPPESNNKSFVYFADTDADKKYKSGDDADLDTVTITKNNYISEIKECSDEACSSGTSVNSLAVVFTRPSSSAVLSANGAFADTSKHFKITIKSPQDLETYIKVYPSGRIQVD